MPMQALHFHQTTNHRGWVFFTRDSMVEEALQLVLKQVLIERVILPDGMCPERMVINAQARQFVAMPIKGHA